MSFILGQSDSISNRSFNKIKYLLSALSVAATSGLVMMLHVHA